MDADTASIGRGFAVVLTTFPELAAAREVARHLVERRLAACVALQPGMISIYRWQGAMEETGEVVVLAKIRAEAAEAVMAAIAALHPYEVPELLVLPVLTASRAYGDWILAETGPEPIAVTAA